MSISRRQTLVRDLGNTGLGVGALMINLSRSDTLSKMSFVDHSHRNSTIRESKALDSIPELTDPIPECFDNNQDHENADVKSIDHVSLEFEKLHYLPPDIDSGMVYKFVIL